MSMPSTLEQTDLPPADAQAVRTQIQHLLASPALERTRRLRWLPACLVEAAPGSQMERLKAYTIALEVLVGVILTPPALAQTLDDVINEVRQAAEEALGPTHLGAGYAGMVNFAVNPDISTATYYIDSGSADDPTLSVTRIPLHYTFTPAGLSWRPFVQLNLAWQTLEAEFDITDDNSVEGDWKTYGGSLSGGAEFPVSDELTLVPALTFGLVRLENEADYDGEVANAILQPALEGVVFDWDARARLWGASLGADYERDLGSFHLRSHGSLSYNYVETYQTSSDLVEFDAHVTTLAVQLETVHPTGMTVGGNPLSWVALLGNTTFMGNDRDALGFEYFFEAGLALETDISAMELPLSSLRLGAKAIFGEDVTGWSLVFGYEF